MAGRPDPAARRRARTIVARLARAYGAGHAARPAPTRRPVLDELIFTLLSQNTSDVNRDRAWASLRAAFPRWADVEAARTDRVARAIRIGGLAKQKAPRIKAVLRAVRRREGRLSLARLARLPDAEVVEELTSLPGIGPKTAACVLAFSLGRPALPVDTHVGRIAARLGFVRTNEETGRAQAVLESLITPRSQVDAHLDLIAHGRLVCTARRPACPDCVLVDLCPTGERELARNPATTRRV